MSSEDLSKPTHYYLDRLVPYRVTFAREYRGMTKKQLAEAISKTPSSISQIEKGALTPDVETFAALSFALGFPKSFFSLDEESIRLDLDFCHFRSKRAISQGQKRRSVRVGTLAVNLLQLLCGLGVSFPYENISPLCREVGNGSEVETLALSVRKAWGLGVGPIPNVLNLLESNGIFVVLLDDSSLELDAYSVWVGSRPCIMVRFDDAMPASRLNFDLAHELGHLLMHEDQSTGDYKTEKQAHRFASSFLAPAVSFGPESPRRWSYRSFFELKRRWRISMQAAMYRSKELGLLSEASFRWGMRKLSMKGERVKEAGEFSKNKPLLLMQALDLVSDEHDLSSLATMMNLHVSELEIVLKIQRVPEDVIAPMRIKSKKEGLLVKLKKEMTPS